MSVAPETSFQYAYIHYPSFTESGASGANLSINSRGVNSLINRLFLTIRKTMAKNINLNLKAGWEHDFFNSSHIVGSFQLSSPFSVTPGSRVKDKGILGIGVSLPITQTGAMFIDYEGTFSGNSATNALSAGLKINV